MASEADVNQAIDNLRKTVFALKEDRDRLFGALQRLVAQHDRPHGFEDSHWYARELADARAALVLSEVGFV